MSMIERVKAAMLATETDVTMWDDEPLTRLARAAIEAMREPTPEMTKAVAFGDYTTFSYGGDLNSFDYFSEENAAAVWRDMFAVALQQEAPK